MDEVIYWHVVPEGDLPPLDGAVPFKVVLIVEADVSREWQNTVAVWLAQSQCRYVLVWGRDCSAWHDAVDLANVRAWPEEIPDEHLIMTTWHCDEMLQDVFWFAQTSASHPVVPLAQIVLIHIAPNDGAKEILAQFQNSLQALRP